MKTEAHRRASVSQMRGIGLGPLGPGVALFVLLPDVWAGQVSIDLRGRNAGMAEQFLDVAEGCSVLQKVGGEAVA